MGKHILLILFMIFSFILAGCSMDFNEVFRIFNSENNNEEQLVETNDNNTSVEDAEGDNAAILAIDILTKSYEAMSTIDSIIIDGVVQIKEQDAANLYEEVRTISLVGLTEAPYDQYVMMSMEGIVGDVEMDGESYFIDGKHYFYMSNEDDQWYVEDAAFEPEYYSFYPLEEYLASVDEFEIVDDTDVYELVFHGDFDGFGRILYGVVFEMMYEIMIEEPFADVETEIVAEQFSLLIDKETFYVQEYRMSGLERGVEVTDYEMETSITFEMHHDKERPNIVVPNDVIATVIDIDAGARQIDPMNDNFGDNFAVPEDMPSDFPFPNGVEVLFTSNQSLDDVDFYVFGFTFDADVYDDEAMEDLIGLYEDYAESIDYHARASLGEFYDFKVTGFPNEEHPTENEYFEVTMTRSGDPSGMRGDDPYGEIKWRKALE